MCNHLINRAFECGLKGANHSVLFALANKASAKNDDQCWPGVQLIARDAGVSVRSVQKALNVLEQEGHITRKMRKHTSTLYTVHPRRCYAPAKPKRVKWPDKWGAKKGHKPRSHCGETQSNPNKEPAGAVVRFPDNHYARRPTTAEPEFGSVKKQRGNGVQPIGKVLEKL